MGPGDVAFDRFEIEAEAGTGGMGTVYRARDRATGGRVALKVVRAPRKSATERLAREAALLAESACANVVRYVAHGTTWIAMEWLEGEDVEQRLSRSPLSLAESLLVARGAAQALAAAHRLGIVHRDVKPANLWLVNGEAAAVKLLDFGVARAAARSSLTAAGAIIGTAAYMAPEQARGAERLDARADVFSLGCVLFECVARRPAFVGESLPAVLAKVLLEEVPPLGEIAAVPLELDALVTRMLSKNPDDRPMNGDDVVVALANIEAASASRERPRAGALGRSEQWLVSIAIVDRAADVASTLQTPSPGLELAQVVEGGALAAYRRVVEAHGARLEPIANGSVIVVLESAGAPMDQACRAARCALDLAKAAPGANVAVSTGRALVDGPRCVGDAIDRAARLLRAPRAERGVRMDRVTAGLVDSRFEVDGDASGLVLLLERPRRDVVRTLLGRPTPCVGRDANLAMLAGAIARTREDDAASAVIVTAPAGVGKTRLAHELLEKLRETDETAVWIARADATSAGDAFGLCAQIVRAQAGIRAGEPLGARREKLRARVARELGEDAAPRVATFLGEMSGTPFPEEGPLVEARRNPVAMGDQIRRAWVDFVEAECSARPLLVVLDDLQWADVGSVGSLDLALAVCRDSPLVVLALARPEVDERFPTLWASRNPTVVRVRPLARKHAEKFVRAVLGDAVGEDVVARVVEQADGNAFSLEELVRSVAEGTTQIPETVLGMIEARMAKLDAETRRALRAASVFGQTFWTNAARALLGAGVTAADVEARLAALERDEWIAARADSTVRGETEYRFRQSVVREAAYAMIAEDDRRMGHGLAGAWLEATGAGKASALADHFERGGDLPRAAAHWARAAEAALEGHALADALACVGRAVACGASGELLGRIAWVEAEARTWRGENEAAFDAALRATALFPEPTRSWADAMASAVGAAFKIGNREEGKALALRLVRALDSGEPTVALLAAVARTAGNLYAYGWLEDGGEVLARAELHAAGAEDAGLRAAIAQASARRAVLAGDASGYARDLEQAMEAFERAGNARMACNQSVGLGYALIELGRFEEAERRLRAGVAEAERLGLTPVSAAARHNLGWALARTGALVEAARVEEEAARVFEQQGDRRMAGACRSYAARIAIEQGQLEKAVAEARAAGELVATVPPLRAMALATLADALGRRGNLATALSTVRDAAAALDAHGAEDADAYVRLVCAEIERTAGDRETARASIHAARARLLARAEKIASAEARSDFLTRVPEHARTLALAREW